MKYFASSFSRAYQDHLGPANACVALRLLIYLPPFPAYQYHLGPANACKAKRLLRPSSFAGLPIFNKAFYLDLKSSIEFREIAVRKKQTLCHAEEKESVHILDRSRALHLADQLPCIDG